MNDLSQSTEDRILSTARELYSDPDAGSPTMDDIARAAGVGRATLYRYFQNRDELLLSVLEREALGIAATVEKRIGKIQQPAEHIIEGMVQAVVEIQKNDLLTRLFQSGNSTALNRLLFNSDRLVNIGRGIMLPVVERAHTSGDLGRGMDFDMLIEWILRILLSLVTVPSRKLDSPAAMRRLLRATMVPVLEK